MAKLALTTLYDVKNIDPTYGLYPIAPELFEYGKSYARFECNDAMLVRNYIAFEGSGFKYDDDTLTDGMITSITFQNYGGSDLFRIVGLKISAHKLPALTDQFDEQLYRMAMKGNDTLRGTGEDEWLIGLGGNDKLVGLNGDDLLDGGKGNDRYTGNAGSDHFVTGIGKGRDVITDFDAVREGDENSQDYISGNGEDLGPYEIRKSGHNTIVDFGDGDMLILLGVKHSQVDASDFLV